MIPTETADELDLRHYIDVLLRRKWAVVASVIVVVVVALALTIRQTPQYRASTEVLLRETTSEQILGGSSETQTNQAQMRVNVATEIEYMKSRSVRDAVRERLGFDPKVSIRPNGETEVVTLSATSPEPEIAAEAADVYAQTYIDIRRVQLIEDFANAADKVQQQIDDLNAQLDDIEAPLNVLRRRLAESNDAEERALIGFEIDDLNEELRPQQDAILARLNRARDQLSALDLSASGIETGGAQLISASQVPEAPFAPTPLRNGVVAVVIGLILGVGIAFLFETLDDRVRSKSDLERVTGWSVIGMIPQLSNWKNQSDTHLVSVEEPNSPAAEAYRTLRTSVQFLGLERPLGVIQITSAQAAEGKSTTLANLGVALARAGNRVIIVDCDMRRPRLSSFFGVTNDVGLTSVLLGEADLADVIKPVSIERRLAVLPSGPPPPNPSELLALRRTAELFALLREECDILLVDSPPVLPVTDAVVLANQVDGVIVVANATKTRQREIHRTAELLEQVNAPVIGLVVNSVSADSGGYGYGYYYGDRYGQNDAVKSEAADRAVDRDRRRTPERVPPGPV